MYNLINQPFVIVAFFVVVIFMLLLDLGIFNKKSHSISNKEAAIWSVVWVSISMLFSVFIYIMTNETSGVEKFTQFQAAYWIEKALSVDNLFVFILVFNYFNVPSEYHHKVLFWGILGALLMRAIFIFSGVGLINVTYIDEIAKGNISPILLRIINIIVLFLLITSIIYIIRKKYKISFYLFLASIVVGFVFNIKDIMPSIANINIPHINILLTLFGLFLIYAGIKSWFVSDDDDDDKDFSKSPGAKFVYKLFNVSKEFDKDKFFTIDNGKKIATPLLVVVGVIEFTDLLFAVDSIPAIFSISRDPFILYTSNIFAILGLRSLYFLLANFIHMFSRLKYGLSIILTFIGIKMVISPFYHISSPLSLTIVGGVLLFSLLASILFPIKENIEANI
jgi:tellurite resistance protein TerC